MICTFRVRGVSRPGTLLQCIATSFLQTVINRLRPGRWSIIHLNKIILLPPPVIPGRFLADCAQNRPESIRLIYLGMACRQPRPASSQVSLFGNCRIRPFPN